MELNAVSMSRLILLRMCSDDLSYVDSTPLPFPLPFVADSPAACIVLAPKFTTLPRIPAIANERRKAHEAFLRAEPFPPAFAVR